MVTQDDGGGALALAIIPGDLPDEQKQVGELSEGTRTSSISPSVSPRSRITSRLLRPYRSSVMTFCKRPMMTLQPLPCRPFWN